jgi:thioesterase domain-containing protein
MGWGHRGFLTGAEELLEEIQKRFDKNTPLVFTGHSLGGAVALACSYGAWVKGLNVREFVGFGTPKVFYKHKKLPTEEVKFTLYKNGNDLVTKVPVFSGLRLIKQIELGHSKRFWPNVSDHNLNKYKENFHQRTDNVARLKGI